MIVHGVTEFTLLGPFINLANFQGKIMKKYSPRPAKIDKKKGDYFGSLSVDVAETDKNNRSYFGFSSLMDVFFPLRIELAPIDYMNRRKVSFVNIDAII